MRVNQLTALSAMTFFAWAAIVPKSPSDTILIDFEQREREFCQEYLLVLREQERLMYQDVTNIFDPANTEHQKLAEIFQKIVNQVQHCSHGVLGCSKEDFNVKLIMHETEEKPSGAFYTTQGVHIKPSFLRGSTDGVCAFVLAHEVAHFMKHHSVSDIRDQFHPTVQLLLKLSGFGRCRTMLAGFVPLTVLILALKNILRGYFINTALSCTGIVLLSVILYCYNYILDNYDTFNDPNLSEFREAFWDKFVCKPKLLSRLTWNMVAKQREYEADEIAQELCGLAGFDILDCEEFFIAGWRYPLFEIQDSHPSEAQRRANLKLKRLGQKGFRKNVYSFADLNNDLKEIRLASRCESVNKLVDNIN